MMPTKLNEKQRAIIPIAAFTANGSLDRLKESLEKGLDAGLTINEIKEILVQMYAYTGFPRSLNPASAPLWRLWRRAKTGGCRDEPGKEASPLPADRTSLEFGTKNQTRLVGQPVAGPLFDFAPAIDLYLKAHLFGDIFQRDVLDWSERELATIAALANIKGVNSQLQAHFAISLNNNITPEQLYDFVNVLDLACGTEVAENAKAVLEQVLNPGKS